MKKEVEFKWIVNLLNSPFAKSGILKKREGGCKIEFERYAQAPSHNKDFRKFFDLLLNDGCIEFFERKITRGGSADTFIIHKKKLKSKLREYALWKDTIKIVDIMEDLT